MESKRKRFSSYEQLLLLLALRPLVKQCVHIGHAAHPQSLRNPGSGHQRRLRPPPPKLFTHYPPGLVRLALLPLLPLVLPPQSLPHLPQQFLLQLRFSGEHFLTDLY